EAEVVPARTNMLWAALKLLQSPGTYAERTAEVVILTPASPSGARLCRHPTTTLLSNTPIKVAFFCPVPLTLPAGPAQNVYVAILRTAGTTVGSTIARNGSTIMGLSENLTLDVNVQYLRLDYVNSSWRIAS